MMNRTAIHFILDLPSMCGWIKLSHLFIYLCVRVVCGIYLNGVITIIHVLVIVFIYIV